MKKLDARKKTKKKHEKNVFFLKKTRNEKNVFFFTTLVWSNLEWRILIGPWVTHRFARVVHRGPHG